MTRKPTKQSFGLLTSDQRLGDKSSERIFRGGQYATGGSDPTAVHSGDAAGGDLAGNYPIPTVPGLATKQPLDTELTALAGLTSAANRVPYFTGAGAAGLLTLDVDGTLAANSDTTLATQKAVKTYADAKIFWASYMFSNTPVPGSLTANSIGIGFDGDTTAAGPALCVTNAASTVFITLIKRITDTKAGTGSGISFEAYGLDARSQKLTSLAAGSAGSDGINKTQFDAVAPTAGEKAALAGTFGTPGAFNKYASDSDPRLLFTGTAPLSVAMRDAILAFSPSLYWDLGSHGATDQSGNGRDGTGAGGITIGAAASLTADGTASTNFDGVDDRITSTYAAFTAGSTRTFFAVASRDTSGSEDTIVGGLGANPPQFEMGGLGADDVEYRGNVGGSRTPVGVWPGNNMIVPVALITNDDASVKSAELFLYGITRGVQTGTFAYATPGNLVLGDTGASTTNPFDGKLSHFAVFEGRLTPGQIAFLTAVALGHAPGRDWGPVTTLPTGALYGDRCTFIASASAGVYWQLVYDGAASFPWKYVGGSPLEVHSNTSRTLTNQTTYASLPTDPLSLTVPLAGDYDVEVQANLLLSSAGGGSGSISYAVGGTAASDTWAANTILLAQFSAASVASRARQLSLAASASIAEKGRTGGNYGVQFNVRRLIVTPVRVG